MSQASPLLSSTLMGDCTSPPSMFPNQPGEWPRPIPSQPLPAAGGQHWVPHNTARSHVYTCLHTRPIRSFFLCVPFMLYRWLIYPSLPLRSSCHASPLSPNITFRIPLPQHESHGNCCYLSKSSPPCKMNVACRVKTSSAMCVTE